jgi:uncharacterized protein YcfJ
MVEAGKDQFMKKLILMMALAGLATAANATEYAKVISSTPVLGDVSTPQRNCWDEQVQVQQPRTGVGATIGAVAGGLLGSTMGRGSGNVAATAAGVVTGAVVGDSLERNSSSTQTVRKCQTTQITQRQTIGYDVVYEYGGQRYTARLAQDPGESLPINVSVSPNAAPAQTSTTTTSTTVVQEPTVVYRDPVYVSPAPVVVDWGWGWGGGPRGPHPRHW